MPPHGGYAAKDGGVSVGCLTPATRKAMRSALDIEGDDMDDPNFNAADPEHLALLDEVYERLRETMRTRTVREWLDLFAEHGVPAAPVQLPELLADDPQAALNVVALEHPANGRQVQAGPFFTMTGTPPEVQGSPPRAGEHNDELLAAAGYGADGIARLRDAGAIG